MSVDDFGTSGLRKALNEIVPDDNTEYYLATKVIEAIDGSFAPSGLSNAGKVTTISVSTTASLIPTTALTNRNAISVLNTSSTTTLYLGFANTVTADTVVGTTSGWEVGPNEIWHVDITDSIPLYGIVASGSILVKILEVS